jgi:hypothetical protein
MPAIGHTSTNNYDAITYLALEYGETSREEEQEMSAETAALLDQVCAPFAHIAEDFSGDCGDILADFDEILDRHFQ